VYREPLVQQVLLVQAGQQDRTARRGQLVLQDLQVPLVPLDLMVLQEPLGHQEAVVALDHLGLLVPRDPMDLLVL